MKEREMTEEESQVLQDYEEEKMKEVLLKLTNAVKKGKGLRLTYEQALYLTVAQKSMVAQLMAMEHCLAQAPMPRSGEGSEPAIIVP